MLNSPVFWKDSLVAAFAAAVVSGIPSTLYAVLSGDSALEATRAAASMIVAPQSSTLVIIVAAVTVHLAVSCFWTLIVHMLLPVKNRVLWASAASVAIALLDLRLIARGIPAIYALEFWPQLADHIAWGVTVGYVLGRRAANRRRN